MIKKPLAVVCVVVAAAGLMATLVHGEDLVTNIKFPFKAAGNAMAAGTYKIYTSQSKLMIRKADEGHPVVLPYLSRVAPKDGGAALVFDKEGEGYILAEVYLSASDGFHLAGAKAKHTHVRVPVP
jgi:hypothetical protein